uniref:Putative ribonuclease H-like domain-containing protein n=1 Tax=Tanacetum cinerariifolium TaxID=118510 RepID=A0A6L2NFP9_TANCI|nr:putative ribonuclease H-like domain-containing protein [Tanacetum cinerariifolium]
MTNRREMMPPPGFSIPPYIPNDNTNERPPVTTVVFVVTTPENTSFAYRASTLTDPTPITKLEYFSEDYDEEFEMEPRPEGTRKVTPPLHTRLPRVRRQCEKVVGFKEAMNKEGSIAGRNTKGSRPSKVGAEENGRREMNLPLLLATHLGRNENDKSDLFPSFIEGLIAKGLGPSRCTPIHSLLQILSFCLLSSSVKFLSISRKHKALKANEEPVIQPVEVTTDSGESPKPELFVVHPRSIAIEKRFGGNAATKKTRRYLLKQQYENFTTSSSAVNEAINTAFGVTTTSTQVNAVNSTNINNLSDAIIYAFLSYDWSDQAGEGPNYALMAYSTLSSNYEPVAETSEVKASEDKPQVVRNNYGPLIIEDWITNSEDEAESRPKIEKKTVKPSFAKIKFVKSKDQAKISKAAVTVNTARSVNTGQPKTIMNAAKPRVPRKKNMYIVDLKNIIPKGGLTCLFAKVTSDEFRLWHRRLRHLNFKTMNKLFKGNLVRGLPSKIFENEQTCIACQKGKQHRASYKAKTENSVCPPLDMLHLDLFGLTFVKSLMKKMYCLVVIDDYSRSTWVFFLSTKDETSGILKSFITRIENLVDHKVKVIRYDNRTEFKNRDMNQFCEMKGILRQYIVARTPRQNGVAERRNKTLIKAVRTMLTDSKLPISFWAEAVNIACYVQNRPVVVGKQSNSNACTKDNNNAGQARKEKEPGKYYILLPSQTTDPPFPQEPKSSQDAGFKPSNDVGNKVNEVPRQENESKDQKEKDSVNSTNTVNVVRSSVNAASNEVNAVGRKSSIKLPGDPNMPKLEDISILEDSNEDVFGLQVKQKKEGIFISQDTYVAEILKKFRFFEVKTAITPMKTQKPLLKDKDGQEVDCKKQIMFANSTAEAEYVAASSCYGQVL